MLARAGARDRPALAAGSCCSPERASAVAGHAESGSASTTHSLRLPETRSSRGTGHRCGSVRPPRGHRSARPLCVLVAGRPAAGRRGRGGLAAFNLVAVTVMCKPWVGSVGHRRAGPPAGGVAVDQGVDWRVGAAEYEVWWTPLTVFDRSRGAFAPGSLPGHRAAPRRHRARGSWPTAPGRVAASRRGTGAGALGRLADGPSVTELYIAPIRLVRAVIANNGTVADNPARRGRPFGPCGPGARATRQGHAVTPCETGEHGLDPG